jgi:hypothetical protein
MDSKGHGSKRKFFLFSDCLLLVKPLKGGKYQKVYEPIPIENCIVWDMKQDKSIKNAFKIVRTDSTDQLIWSCPSSMLKETWMNIINESISNSGGKIKLCPLHFLQCIQFSAH